MELQNIQRLAVFKMRNIGDVLMITPALRALRETFPAARITVVVNSGTEAMLTDNPHIDEVLVFYRPKGQHRPHPLARLLHELRFLRELRKRKFNLTIGFTDNSRTAWYTFFCGARYRAGISYNRWSKYDPRRYFYNLPSPDKPDGMHEVEKHFWLLEKYGIELRSATPGDLCLVIPEEARNWARHQLQPLRPAKIVHVHPVARWLRKCWNDQSMAQVIDWLQEQRDARVVVSTGPIERERERARRIVDLCRTKPVFYDGQCSLNELGALTAESDCFLGVDTAPMHIAAAVGTPVIALFGPTGLTDWHPWHSRGRVLTHGCPCKEQALDTCGPDPNQPRACMEAITVEEVEAAIDEVLSH
jgi:heptosyltransferase III